MHRGVLYGVVAFGLVVGLGAFAYSLAGGESLTRAVWVCAVLVAALVFFPLRHLAPGGTRATSRGGRRETLGVALLVFALLTCAGGVIVGLVGQGPWIREAVALLAVAAVVAGAGVWVLRRRPARDALTWHE